MFDVDVMVFLARQCVSGQPMAYSNVFFILIRMTYAFLGM